MWWGWGVEKGEVRGGGGEGGGLGASQISMKINRWLSVFSLRDDPASFPVSGKLVHVPPPPPPPQTAPVTLIVHPPDPSFLIFHYDFFFF